VKDHSPRKTEENQRMRCVGSPDEKRQRKSDSRLHGKGMVIAHDEKPRLAEKKKTGLVRGEKKSLVKVGDGGTIRDESVYLYETQQIRETRWFFSACEKNASGVCGLTKGADNGLTSRPIRGGLM